MRSMKLLMLATVGLIGSAQTVPTPLARLQGNIERLTKSINADWGIYVKCLETNEEIAINADKQMDT